MDVRHEVRRDVLGVFEQPGEGVAAGVVERIFPVRIGGIAEQAVHGRFGGLLLLKLPVLFENGVPGGRKNAVEPPQDDHGQHHQSILRGSVRPPEPVGDFPDPCLELVVRLKVHGRFFFSRSLSARRRGLFCSLAVLIGRSMIVAPHPAASLVFLVAAATRSSFFNKLAWVVSCGLIASGKCAVLPRDMHTLPAPCGSLPATHRMALSSVRLKNPWCVRSTTRQDVERGPWQYSL